MNRSPDVIVVGAGVIGLAIAHELSRRGARVDVIDTRPPGQGATQASAGMLAPHAEAHPATPDSPAAPADEASATLWSLGVRSLDLYDGFIECVRADSDVDVEYRRSGSLHVAWDESRIGELRALGARLAAVGVGADVLEASLVRELEPQIDEQVRGGLYVASHGYVVASQLVEALRAGCALHGASVASGRVLRIGAVDSSLQVATADQQHACGAVVVAAGSWTSRVVVQGDETLPVRPVRGQLVQLDWPAAPLGRIVWGPDCYLVPWVSGALLVGATVEEAGFDERTTVAGVRDLLDAACDLLPRAWQATFSGARAGLRPGTPDGLPILGPSPGVPGVFYATGHYRNGVLLAPLTALLVADLVLGDRRDPMLGRLAPARFVRGSGGTA